jgi:hypothetical protein
LVNYFLKANARILLSGWTLACCPVRVSRDP